MKGGVIRLKKKNDRSDDDSSEAVTKESLVASMLGSFPRAPSSKEIKKVEKKYPPLKKIGDEKKKEAIVDSKASKRGKKTFTITQSMLTKEQRDYVSAFDRKTADIFELARFMAEVTERNGDANVTSFAKLLGESRFWLMGIYPLMDVNQKAVRILEDAHKDKELAIKGSFLKHLYKMDKAKQETAALEYVENGGKATRKKRGDTKKTKKTRGPKKTGEKKRKYTKKAAEEKAAPEVVTTTSSVVGNVNDGIVVAGKMLESSANDIIALSTLPDFVLAGIIEKSGVDKEALKGAIAVLDELL